LAAELKKNIPHNSYYKG